MESFEKSSHYYKQVTLWNVISFLTAHTCPFLNIVQFLKFVLRILVCTQFLKFVLKSNFIETLNLQTELFMSQQKELFFTEMKLFKNKLLTSLKHNTKSHSPEPSNNTDRMISLLQVQIEFLKEQLKSNDEIINSLRKSFQKRRCIFFCKRQQH